MTDSHLRSWTKSFTWRVLGIFILLFLSYLITGDWEKSSLITVIFHLIRVVLYYFHERLWQKVSWGKGNNANPFWFWFWLMVLILTFLLCYVLPA